MTMKPNFTHHVKEFLRTELGWLTSIGGGVAAAASVATSSCLPFTGVLLVLILVAVWVEN